jgi:hypothetical protein
VNPSILEADQLYKWSDSYINGLTTMSIQSLSAHGSRRLLAPSFIPLAGYRSGLRSSFPAWPILFAPTFGIGVPH